MQEVDRVCSKGKSGMINLQKISVLFVLFVLLGKNQVLGGCGSSKAAPPETADTTDPSHSYRTQLAHKSQEQRQNDAVSETQTKSQFNITQTKEIQNGGAGATTPVQQSEPSKNKPAKEEAIEATPKAQPTIEKQSTGKKNSIIQPPPRSKTEAARERRVKKRETLGAQTRASHGTDKPSHSLPPRRLKKKPQVATAAGSRNGTQPSSQRQGKPRVAFAEGAGTRPAPLKGKEPTEKGGLTKKKQKLLPLPEPQKKQALLITVSSPGEARTDAPQSINTVPKSVEVKPLQSEQDKVTSVVVAPLNALQTPRLKTEEEPKLTPRSPLALEKPTEPIKTKVGALQELTLDLPGQTPPRSTSELGAARREMSPALSRSAALILGASEKDDEGEREKTASKILETMKNFLKGNKLIPLGSESLAFYEKALMESKSVSTRISTKNFRSPASNHMNRLLDILAAAPNLREIVFEDPFDFVYMEGAGKPDIKISLGDIIEKLTESKSLQTVSFHGLPREDQLNDFTYNFKNFIRKDKTRQFTVVFREVSPRHSAGVATTLKSTFGERVDLKMKE